LDDVGQRAKLQPDNRQVQTDDEVAALCGLYFDGRKGKTIVQGKVGANFYCRLSLSNMSSYRRLDLSILKTFWLGTEYSIVNIMATNNIDTSKLISVRCDGFAVNTGTRGCVITTLKEHIGRLAMDGLFALRKRATTMPFVPVFCWT
jgi:hypothetical protein